jgi:hypothetical protein
MKEVVLEFPLDVRVVETAGRAGTPALLGYLFGLLIGAAVGVPLVLLLFGG